MARAIQGGSSWGRAGGDEPGAGWLRGEATGWGPGTPGARGGAVGLDEVGGGRSAVAAVVAVVAVTAVWVGGLWNADAVLCGMGVFAAGGGRGALARGGGGLMSRCAVGAGVGVERALLKGVGTEEGFGGAVVNGE